MMDALKYCKAKNRMKDSCGIDCEKCLLRGICDFDLDEDYIKESIDIVEKWDKEHPAMTNLDVFKKEVEKYIKNTFKDIKLKLYCSENMPYLLCPNFSNCENCKKYWNDEYKGDEK